LDEISKINKPDIALFFSPGISIQCEKIDQLKMLGIKTAIWLTDDPYYIDITRFKVSCFDVIFTQEINCVSVYQSYGCKKVYYLPLGADPDIFKPKAVSSVYESDILFIGNAFGNRLNLIDSIARYLKTKNTIILGLYWERLKTYRYLKQNIRRAWVSPEETANYYNGAKIVLNIHRLHNDPQININTLNINAISPNPRAFEISACGAFQLTDVREGLTNLYTPGKDIATYNSLAELIHNIEHYLIHESERKAIALNGLKKTQDEHIYLKRIQKLLDLIYE
jgi:spore maturation protein CgeB